jgi:hypothetical protein
MNKLWLCGALLYGLWPYPAHVSAHNADELKAVFEPTPVPVELLEATKELNATAGMKSIREEAHDKQHALLDQYLRAVLDRQCRESLENITRIDRQIVEVRDTGNTESEQDLRHLRDETAAFVETKCADTSLDNLLKQQP